MPDGDDDLPTARVGGGGNNNTNNTNINMEP